MLIKPDKPTFVTYRTRGVEYNIDGTRPELPEFDQVTLEAGQELYVDGQILSLTDNLSPEG